MTKLLVIGAVTAGTSAAAKARRVDSKLEIKLLAESQYISYGSCGLPYFIGGAIAAKEKLLARSIENFAQQGIEVKNLCKATEINLSKQKVIFRNLAQNSIFEEFYDKLIIATGARPIIFDWPGTAKKGIFTLRTINDGVDIKEYLRLNKPGQVLIVGAGYIGLEMAENLSALGFQVTLVERGSQVAPSMDPDMALIIQEHLEQKGIKVLVNQEIKGFEGGETVAAAFTGSGVVPADFVLVSIGVRPNSELATDAGIKLGVGRAIEVNSQMETNIDGVYSAGDCATTTNLVTGEDVYIPMGTTANKQGRVAGENAAGGNAAFKGVLGTGIARVFDLEISRTGMTEKECREKGFKFISHTVKSRTAALPGYSGDVWIKIIVDEKTRRILGGQIAGYSGAGKRIDIIATAITLGARLEDIFDADLAYSPPFSPVWDPVLVALNQFR
ncbi:MAG: FAD-dependent oxidoreductase [Syntrophomonas sp.]